MRLTTDIVKVEQRFQEAPGVSTGDRYRGIIGGAAYREGGCADWQRFFFSKERNAPSLLCSKFDDIYILSVV